MVGRCSDKRRLIRSIRRFTATYWEAARRDPEGKPMRATIRVNVSVKVDIAAILLRLTVLIALLIL